MIVLAVAAVFGVAVTFGFVNWDDGPNIYRNTNFQPATGAAILSAWTSARDQFYLPVTYSIWAILAWVSQTFTRTSDDWGLAPWIFHLFNLGVHALSGILVFRILERVLTRTGRSDPRLALLGAAFFVVHPMQAEPVVWATGLKDLLGGCFALLSISLYLEFLEQRRLSSYIATMVAIVLASLSKSGEVAVLPVLGVLQLAVYSRPWKETARQLAPLGVPVVAIALLTMGLRDPAFERFGPPFPLSGLVALDSLGFYLAQTLFPRQLPVLYHRSPELMLRGHLYVMTVPLLIAAAFIAIRARRRGPLVPLGFAVFALTLLPYSGIVPFTAQWQSTVTDRYAYLALFGAALVFVGMLRDRKLAIGAVLVATLALRAGIQARVWQNTETLFAHVLAHEPGNPTANFRLASLREEQGRFEEAIPLYERGLLGQPDEPEVTARIAKIREGNPDRMRQEVRATAAIDRGEGFARLGRLEAAASEFEGAIAADPRSATGWVDLANTFAMRGRFDEAEKGFAKALEADPHQAVALWGIGNVHLLKGDAATAIDFFQRSLASQPGFAPAVEGLRRARAIRHGGS